MRDAQNSSQAPPPTRDHDAAVLSFLRSRSAPCPRCASELRDLPSAVCPRCGEPLILRVGAPRLRFGWLIVAMVPGSFSGVAAVFVLLPIAMTIGRQFPPGQGLPIPVIVADVFGFLSAASVVVIYRRRHRVLAWSAHRQAGFAGVVWGVHLLMLVLLSLAMIYWY